MRRAERNARPNAEVSPTTVDYQQLCTIIERNRDADIDRHCDNLAEDLTAAPLQTVEDFHDTLAGIVDWLDSWELRVTALLAFGSPNPTKFDGLRARLILAGRALFEQVAADPVALCRLGHTTPWECPRLLELAPAIYQQRTGRPLPRRSSGRGTTASDRLRLEDHRDDFRRRFPEAWRRRDDFAALSRGLAVDEDADADRWLFELIDATRDPDPDRHCDNLARHLDAAPLCEVVAVQRNLARVLETLDTTELRTAAALVFAGLTEQTFAEFRARLVLAGRPTVEGAIRDPIHVHRLDHAAPLCCPRLLQLAPEVYQQRTAGPIPAWTCDALPVDPPDDPPEGYLERFAARFPEFWRHYPWELGWAGWRRERLFIEQDCMPLGLRRWLSWQRRITRAGLVLTLLGVLALLTMGRWLAVLMVFVVIVTGLGLFTVAYGRKIRSCFIDARQRTHSDGPLTGTVRYRVVRLNNHRGQRRRYRPTLDAGLQRLVKEATRYGKTVRFVEQGPPVVTQIRERSSLARSIDEAAEVIERVRDELRADDGPSFVMVVSDAGDDALARNSLRAACVSVEEDSGAYAHEILHLFGAFDLYESRCHTQFRQQARRRFIQLMYGEDFEPDQISIMDDDGHRKACVDRFTARVIGWV